MRAPLLQSLSWLAIVNFTWTEQSNLCRNIMAQWVRNSYFSYLIYFTFVLGTVLLRMNVLDFLGLLAYSTVFFLVVLFMCFKDGSDAGVEALASRSPRGPFSSQLFARFIF